MPTPSNNSPPPKYEPSETLLAGLVIGSLALFNLVIDYAEPFGSQFNFLVALLTFPVGLALLLAAFKL